MLRLLNCGRRKVLVLFIICNLNRIDSALNIQFDYRAQMFAISLGKSKVEFVAKGHAIIFEIQYHGLTWICQRGPLKTTTPPPTTPRTTHLQFNQNCTQFPYIRTAIICWRLIGSQIWYYYTVRLRNCLANENF